MPDLHSACPVYQQIYRWCGKAPSFLSRSLANHHHNTFISHYSTMVSAATNAHPLRRQVHALVLLLSRMKMPVNVGTEYYFQHALTTSYRNSISRSFSRPSFACVYIAWSALTLRKRFLVWVSRREAVKANLVLQTET